MGEPKVRCVKVQARRRFGSVPGVPDDRIPYGSEVHPHLMHATRQGLHLEEGPPVPEATESSVSRDRGFSRSRHLGGEPAFGEGQFDPPVFGLRPARDHGVVAFLDPPAGEVLTERSCGSARLGEDEKARGRRIQPVHRPQGHLPSRAAAQELLEELEGGSPKTGECRVGRHSRRFVDGCDPGILVEEPSTLEGLHVGRRERVVQANDFGSFPDPARVKSRAFSVDPDRTGRDQRAGPSARKARNVLGQQHVEALARILGPDDPAAPSDLRDRLFWRGVHRLETCIDGI
jgi:hypothetical protein